MDNYVWLHYIFSEDWLVHFKVSRDRNHQTMESVDNVRCSQINAFQSTLSSGQLYKDDKTDLCSVTCQFPHKWSVCPWSEAEKNGHIESFLHILVLRAFILKKEEERKMLVPGKKSNLLQVLKSVTFCKAWTNALRKTFHDCIQFMLLHPMVTAEPGVCLKTAKESTARRDMSLPLSKKRVWAFIPPIHCSFLQLSW